MGLESMLLELESLSPKIKLEQELESEVGSFNAIRDDEYNIALLDKGFAVKMPFVLNRDIINVVKEVYNPLSDVGSNAFGFFMWVVSNIKYGKKRRGKKGYRNSVEVFEDKEGVCGEMSALYLTMARAIGIRGSYVGVDVDHKGKAVNHACAMIDVKGKHNGNVLVDPAYGAYDVSHRSFRPMTDFEVYNEFNTI